MHSSVIFSRSPASYGSNFVQDLSIIPATKDRERSLYETFKNLAEISEKGAGFRFYRSLFPVIYGKKRDNKTEEGGSQGSEESLKLKLLLSAEQMIQENYPLPLPGKLTNQGFFFHSNKFRTYAIFAGLMKQKYSEYVKTCDEYQEAHDGSPLISVDCEMCLCDGVMELTRICLVDEDLKVRFAIH